jgi:hypothetical protein
MHHADPDTLARLQEAALERCDDAALLRLREHAQEDRGLPRVIDGARRGAPVAADPIATTWQCWDVQTGAPVLVRALRVRWRTDPLLRRRLAATAGRTPRAPGVLRPELRLDGDWPHLRWALPGPRLADTLAPEPDEPADPVDVARLVAEGLRLAAALDAAGLSPRPHEAATLVAAPGGLALAWLDAAGDAPGPPRSRSFTAPARRQDPTGATPLGALAHTWAQGAAPDLPAARALCTRALADELAAGRHALARAAGRSAEGRRAARLHALVRRLSAALPPPTAHVVLRAGRDRTLVAAWSDGQTVRAGAAATPAPRFLPPVWSAEDGLDARQVRVALRAWRTRDTGDPDRQAALQAELPGTPADAEALVRWLAGQATLRRAELLLRAWRARLSPRVGVSPRSPR